MRFVNIRENLSLQTADLYVNIRSEVEKLSQ